MSLDESGGEVEITDGGINHRYVEMRFHSQIGKGLDYIVLVYTDPPIGYNSSQI